MAHRSKIPVKQSDEKSPSYDDEVYEAEKVPESPVPDNLSIVVMEHVMRKNSRVLFERRDIRVGKGDDGKPFVEASITRSIDDDVVVVEVFNHQDQGLGVKNISTSLSDDQIENFHSFWEENWSPALPRKGLSPPVEEICQLEPFSAAIDEYEEGIYEELDDDQVEADDEPEFIVTEQESRVLEELSPRRSTLKRQEDKEMIAPGKKEGSDFVTKSEFDKELEMLRTLVRDQVALERQTMKELEERIDVLSADLEKLKITLPTSTTKNGPGAHHRESLSPIRAAVFTARRLTPRLSSRDKKVSSMKKGGNLFSIDNTSAFVDGNRRPLTGKERPQKGKY